MTEAKHPVLLDNHLLEQFSSVECGKGCEAAIDGDVVGGHEVRALAMVQGGLKELSCRRLVPCRKHCSDRKGWAGVEKMVIRYSIELVKLEFINDGKKI